MLFQENKLYSTTKVTNYGKQLLLSGDNSFNITHFALIDEETNYNLVNKDINIFAKGFGKVNTQENDDYSNINSQIIFDSQYKIHEIRDFIFGEYHNHNLIPEEIKNEADVIIDMQGGELNIYSATSQSKKAKKFEVKSQIISGNIGIQIVDTSEINSYSFLVDIKGELYKYYDDDSVEIFQESYSGFSAMYYTIHFQSFENANDNFSITENILPESPLIISVSKIKKNIFKNNNVNLYGIFTIQKVFVYNSTEYNSDVIEVILQKPIINTNAIEILTKNDIARFHELPNERRNIYAYVKDFDSRKVNPQVYSSIINNSVFNQMLNGYISAKDNITIDFKTSYANNIRLYLQNISNGYKYSLFTLLGSAPLINDENAFTTIHNFQFSLTFIKQISNKGMSFIVVPNIPEKIGLAELRETSIIDRYRTLQYEFNSIENSEYFVQMIMPISLDLFSESQYDSLKTDDRLFALQCEEHNLVYNYDFSRNIYINDFQNLIIDMVN